MGAEPQLAIDSLGIFHIAFQDVTNQSLWYIQGDGSGTAMNMVGSSNGLYHALALGQDDRPRLAFWNQNDSLLNFAYARRMPELALTGAWLRASAARCWAPPPSPSWA